MSDALHEINGGRGSVRSQVVHAFLALVIRGEIGAS